ncbi:hypothetical protein [Actinomyces sp. S4-C9]|uniref:hypothetical protein n=1 Tax=Actinomyces sp. S4-C9 TaxID=1219581 RepID=UPI001E341F4F|nr:hypothetical protein [Actinomyces sp. S4-C9]
MPLRYSDGKWQKEARILSLSLTVMVYACPSSLQWERPAPRTGLSPALLFPGPSTPAPG